MKIKSINKSKIKISSLGILYVLSMVYAELFQAGIIGGYYLSAFIVSIFWFALGMAHYFLFNDKSHFFYNNKKAICFVLFPWMIFVFYNMCIYLGSIAYKPFMKSSFVQISWTIIIVLGAIGSYFIFGDRTIRYFLYSVFLTYVVTLVHELFSMGPFDFLRGVLSIFTGNSVGNPFEKNSDMVLALGILSIFYFDIFIKEKKGYRNHGLIIIILVLLGGKRIEVIAILGCILASIITGLISEKKRKYIQNLISVLIIAMSFAFVYIVLSGKLSNFIYAHGINSMGRIKMWDYVAQYAAFDKCFMGNGYSFSNLILEQERVHTYQGHVYVLHSDVLKIYVDLGFWMFLYWTVYILYVFPKKIRKYYGYKVGNLAWYTTVFLFVLYFTDNAINYFITQTVFCYVLFETIRLNSGIGIDQRHKIEERRCELREV